MSNQLQNFYRQVKVHTKLPSNGNYYGSGVLTLSDATNEVAVKGMTGDDEITFKNPDALLSGNAMSQALKSCVIGLGDASELLVNDVDTLMIAIRIASYGPSLPIDITCPSCNSNQSYNLNLESLLDGMQMLEDSYVVNLYNGLSVFVKPYRYKDTVKAALEAFEQSKIAKSIVSTDDDYKKLTTFTTGFDRMVRLKVELTANSIVKIVSEQHDVNIVNNSTNRSEIINFLKNIETKDVDLIERKISEINEIGIPKKIHIGCQSCKHEWDQDTNFDPVNFLSGS